MLYTRTVSRLCVSWSACGNLPVTKTPSDTGRRHKRHLLGGCGNWWTYWRATLQLQDTARNFSNNTLTGFSLLRRYKFPGIFQERLQFFRLNNDILCCSNVLLNAYQRFEDHKKFWTCKILGLADFVKFQGKFKGFTILRIKSQAFSILWTMISKIQGFSGSKVPVGTLFKV